MNQCYEYQIWILSYHIYDPKCTEAKGFACECTTSERIPSFFEEKLQYWSSHTFTKMKREGILPPPGQ